MTLAQLKPGEYAIISGFNSELKSKGRLVEMGFLPETEIRFIKQAPFNGAVELKIRDYYVSIRPEDSQNILVEKK